MRYPPPMSHEALHAEITSLVSATCDERGYLWETHSSSLSWRIYPTQQRSLHRCYELQALPDRSGLLFFYGNSDAGPVPMLLRRCIHIPFPPPFLADRFAVGDLLRQVLGDPQAYPPNTYGLS